MSHSALNEFQASGLNVEIHADEDVRDPRQEFDHSTTFALSHRRYSLADETDGALDEQADSLGGLIAAAREAFDVVAISPVYGYDHGSLTASTTPFSCPWDSGVLGVAFVTREQADSGWGEGSWTEETLLAAIRCEVEEYAQYLRGEVYGYVIKDNDDEVLDSCWGLYGSEYAEEAAREAAKDEQHWLVEKAEGEAYALLQALDTPDVFVALAAARQGVR